MLQKVKKIISLTTETTLCPLESTLEFNLPSGCALWQVKTSSWFLGTESCSFQVVKVIAIPIYLSSIYPTQTYGDINLCQFNTEFCTDFCAFTTICRLFYIESTKICTKFCVELTQIYVTISSNLCHHVSPSNSYQARTVVRNLGSNKASFFIRTTQHTILLYLDDGDDGWWWMQSLIFYKNHSTYHTTI